MDISFVVLSWNSQDDIEQCIGSIKRFCKKDSIDYKIYIVDNGSTDGTLKSLGQLDKERTIEVIYLDKNYGTTYSRNLALKRIDTEYVCILDSDTELLQGSIKQLLSFLHSDRKIGLIAPKLIYENGVVQNSVKKFPTFDEKIAKLARIFKIGKYNTDDFYKNFPFVEPTEVDTAISAAWFFPGKILEIVGLLDENIFYAPEDVDYSLRIWKAGYKIVYYPNFEILHKTKQISHTKPFSKISISHFIGLLYYYKKHRYFFSRDKIYRKINSDNLVE